MQRKNGLLAIILVSTILSGCIGGADNGEDSQNIASNEARIEEQGSRSASQPDSEDDTTKEQESEKEKQPFYIQTLPFGSFGNDITVQKSAVVRASSDLTVSAQTSGRVRSIAQKSGNSLERGSHLVYLDDSIASLGLRIQEARNSVEAAQLNYQSQLVSLNKSIQDATTARDRALLDVNTAKLALEKSQLDLDNARYGAEEQIAQARRSVDTVNLDQNLANIDQSIAKARLDIENLKLSNREQIRSFETSFQDERTNITLFLTDVINILEDIYGFENGRIPNDDFLGAKDRGAKVAGRQAYLELINYRNTLGTLFTDVDTTNIESLTEAIQTLQATYGAANNVLTLTEIVLNASIAGGSLTDAGIAGFKGSINGLQGTYQGRIAGLTAFLNQARTFLSTFEQQFTATEKQLQIQINDLELQRINIQAGEKNTESAFRQTQLNVDSSVRQAENVVKNADNSLKTIQNALENAQNNLNNAIKIKDVTLRQLSNQIRAAQIRLTDTQVQYGKLTITSPIQGVVSSILVDIGQEVAPGTPIALLSGKVAEVTVGVNQGIVGGLNVGDPVEVTYNNQVYSGAINSVATTADASLNYEVVVRVDGLTSGLGGFATVNFSSESNYRILPIALVSITGPETGELWVTKSKVADSENKDITPEKKQISLGKIYGDKIEVVNADLSEDAQVIISDMSSYRPEEFMLEVKE